MTEIDQKSVQINFTEPELSDLITSDELSLRLGITKKAISRKIEKGILIQGKHWFRPRGYRTTFSWRAIEETIRQDGKPHMHTLDQPKDASDGLHDR